MMVLIIRIVMTTKHVQQVKAKKLRTFKKTENTKCESCTILAGLLKNAYSHSDSHAGCYSIEDHNKDRIQISKRVKRGYASRHIRERQTMTTLEDIVMDVIHIHGYHKNPNGKCVENVCLCSNGDPKRGTACPINGKKVDAIIATQGFISNQHDKKNVENECTCTNGVAVTGTKCDVHGRHHCEQCNHHYVLSLLDVGHRTAKEAKSPYYTDEQDENF